MCDHPSKDVISPSSLHNDVAVSLKSLGSIGRCPMHDDDADGSPPAEDLVSMEFGSTRLGVVEIAPGKTLDAVDTEGSESVGVGL